MTPEQFSKRIKTKYPQYQNIDDRQLAQRIIAKYPQYASSVNFSETPEERPSLLERAEDVGTSVTDFLGGGNVAETFGAELAKRQVPEEQREFIEQPSVKETAGSGLALGSALAPMGRIASGIAIGARALGLGGRAAQTAGNIGAGGTVGAGVDIGMSTASGGEAELGLGTLLGAGIPAATPVGKALIKGAGKVGAEIQGAITGTSGETIEQAFVAARKGGNQAEQFRASLRGQTTPEELVRGLEENIDVIQSGNQRLFRETLSEIGDTVVSSAPAKQRFADQLSDAGVVIGEDGLLDFTNSKLRTVPNAQTKLQQAWQEVSNMPEQMTLEQVDTTRQAISAIKQIGGDEPSANLANMLIDDGVRSVREAGEQVQGYGQMLDNFGETAEFLSNIKKGVSSGNQKTIDQTYRRLITTLKTNNERRQALVQKLDDATGGAILSSVSGQQLSETMPRGIIRAFAAGLGGVSVLTGQMSLAPALTALVAGSPRVTGEFVNALGIGARRADIMIETINELREILIKAGAISGAASENSE